MKTYKEIDSFSEWSANEKDVYCVNVIKGLIMDGVRHANSGHTGGPMSSADFATILFKEFLTFDPENPDWFNRDRFVLSAGHESMLLYALLFHCGWLTMEDLRNFRQLHSRTPGHPEVDIPGVEATTGPLGQGVGMGVGMAVAEAYLHQYFESRFSETKGLIDHFTYILCGDGDLQEPIALGAAALAGHWGLSKLIMYYDANDVQIAGATSRSDSTDIKTVFKGFKWNVESIDGHNHHAIRQAIINAQQSDGPSLIIGKTTMAKGSASMEGSSSTHGSPLPPDEIAATKLNLGLDPASFSVPDVCLHYFQKSFDDKAEKIKRWKTQLFHIKDSEFEQDWNVIIEGYLADPRYPDFTSSTELSTRKAFGQSLELFAEEYPHLVGGSADLDPSNCTDGFAAAYGHFSMTHTKGRNLSFGVREFPMAAIMNGLALHGGIIPFGGTFLVFSDYSRPAIRLGALQKIRVIHEFTHDSFYVGEDGPTHQPVEHIMALRAIPNLQVFRPADAKETAICFRLALESMHSPSVLLLSRQNLPVIDKTIDDIEDGVRKGGYEVIEAKGKPEIVLIATGSEVALAMAVAKSMGDKKCRVVSIPCWEIFQQQSDEYIQSLIPLRGCLKVSLEAGVTLGWEKFVGINGITIGIDHFGASAPAKDLAQEFGFTVEKVEQTIREHLEKL